MTRKLTKEEAVTFAAYVAAGRTDAEICKLMPHDLYLTPDGVRSRRRRRKLKSHYDDKVDWSVVDWTMTDVAICAMLGCSKNAVMSARDRFGVPRSSQIKRVGEKITFRPGSLAGPMEKKIQETGEGPSEYLRRLVAEDCGRKPPKMDGHVRTIRAVNKRKSESKSTEE